MHVNVEFRRDAGVPSCSCAISCDLFRPMRARRLRGNESPENCVEHSISRTLVEILLPAARPTGRPEIDISADRSTGKLCLFDREELEASVEAGSGETFLPGIRRLNEMCRNASRVFLPLARHGQSAERARATPLLRRVRGPGGGPGVGVALARGTLEQSQIARNICMRIRSRFQTGSRVRIASGITDV